MTKHVEDFEFYTAAAWTHPEVCSARSVFTGSGSAGGSRVFFMFYVT